jgi:transposase
VIRSDVRVWLAAAPLDMRKGFDTLAEAVRTVLELDPLSGHLFVFRSRDGCRIKILWWDSNGYCIYCKRLERGTFLFPDFGELSRAAADALKDRQSIAIDSASLMKLLSGLPVDIVNNPSRHG